MGSAAMGAALMDIDYIDYSDDPAGTGPPARTPRAHNGESIQPPVVPGPAVLLLVTGDEEALRISKRIGDCLCWWITGPMSYALRFTGARRRGRCSRSPRSYEVTHEEKYRDAALKVVDGPARHPARVRAACVGESAGSGIYSGYMLTMTFNGIWDVWRPPAGARPATLEGHHETGDRRVGEPGELGLRGLPQLADQGWPT